MKDRKPLLIVLLVLVFAAVASQFFGSKTSPELNGGQTASSELQLGNSAGRNQIRSGNKPISRLYRLPQLSTVSSQQVKSHISELKGVPVVVNFWASYCKPCLAELPMMIKTAQSQANKVAFIGFNALEADVDKGRRFALEQGIPFPSFRDPDRQISSDLFSTRPMLPTTIFLDRRGKVVAEHAGEYSSSSELESDIERYLKVSVR